MCIMALTKSKSTRPIFGFQEFSRFSYLEALLLWELLWGHWWHNQTVCLLGHTFWELEHSLQQEPGTKALIQKPLCLKNFFYFSTTLNWRKRKWSGSFRTELVNQYPYFMWSNTYITNKGTCQKNVYKKLVLQNYMF